MKKSLPKYCLDQMPFSPCPCKPFLNPIGVCFEPFKELGEGYYWYYEKEGMFAVSVVDILPYVDYTVNLNQPDFISLNYFDTIKAQQLTPNKEIPANRIRGYVSTKEPFQATYYKDVRIHGIELILMPSYYQDYLETIYPNEFPDAKSAFQSIDGCLNFPELVFLLKQIEKFQGSGLAAHLYYKSKVDEALSLIIEKTKQNQKQDVLSKQDLEQLQAVTTYIQEHIQEEIKTETLTKIACMGQTKLRATFKNQYGYTITKYIQVKRIEEAKKLLKDESLTIQAIAKQVGYHHAGRFSALFKKQTGLSPDEYKKML